MREITLIFPNQLFEQHPALSLNRTIVIAEDFLFFRLQTFHKQKLILLRAAMKQFAAHLEKRSFEVTYIDSNLLKKRDDLSDILLKKEIQKIHIADLADDWLHNDLKTAAKQYKWELIFYDSPMFLCGEKEIRSYFKEKKLSLSPFYAYQRKKMSLLMNKGLPVGGKFSFDKENRKRIPKKCNIPDTDIPKWNLFISEANEYVKKEFPNAIGKVDLFLYPTNFIQARKALLDFIQNKLFFFGDYEDAISQKEPILFHSLLSPLLNIGLLTPVEVIKSVLQFHQENPIPINSLEGFLRQIIGWREFIRGCYLTTGRKMRTSNYFEHTKPINKRFWEGKTGILPVDATIQKVLSTGYCHHIERLMILGNFLLLIETHPDAVYHWFMSFFIDAYDWVMVPNVYGMSQYSDKGCMVTKPYISSANYILKMSDYPKGDWVEIWDGLFWRFLLKHKGLFKQNHRTAMLLQIFEKNKKMLVPKVENAEVWLRGYY